MSAATLDAPSTEALPDMGSTFTAALAQNKAAENGDQPVQVEAKAPVKEAGKDLPLAAKVEAPAKKKSALESALSEDAPVEAVVVDESAKVFEASEPSKDNWAKARDTFKKQSEELKVLRETSKKASEPPPEILSELKTLKEERAKLKEDNDRMRDNIVALDVRFDPSVQDKMQAREKSVSKLSETIKENGADAQAFIDAMALPVNKRASAIDGILENITSSRARTTIETKLAQIELADEQLEEQLSNPHKTFEELKQQREIEAKARQEHADKFKAATFEKVERDLPKLSKLMKAVPADVEGADEFNADLQKDLARAPQLLDVSPEEAVQQCYKAARYDSVEKLLVKSQGRISELETALAKYEGAEPGFRGGGKPAAKADWERPAGEVYNEALAAQRGT